MKTEDIPIKIQMKGPVGRLTNLNCTFSGFLKISLVKSSISL